MCYENVPEENHEVSALTTATPFRNKDKFLTLSEELLFSITSCELPLPTGTLQLDFYNRESVPVLLYRFICMIFLDSTYK